MSVRRFPVSVESLSQLSCLPSVEELRPPCCPLCQERSWTEDGLQIVGHGTYRRQLLGLTTGCRNLVVWIRRFLCRSCRHTISVLPDDLYPGRWYAGVAIVLSLVLGRSSGLQGSIAGIGDEVPSPGSIKIVSTTAKDRWARIDIRKHCKLVELRIVDAAQEPIPGATVWLNRKLVEGPSHWGYSMGANGRVAMAIPPGGAAARIAVWGDEFRPLQIASFDSDRTVVLQPAFPVRLEVENLPKLPADLVFEARTRSGDDKVTLSSIRRELDAKGASRLYVTEPGVYQLVLSLRQREQGAVFRWPPFSYRPREFLLEFIVPGDAGPEPLPVRLRFADAEHKSVKQAVQELRRSRRN